jgi:acetyl esterase/lipase
MKKLAIGAWLAWITSALSPPAALAQLSPSAEWAAHLPGQYRVADNQTYVRAGGEDLKLDVYQRLGVQGPQPTLVYMHGGFWAAGTKEGSVLILMPWLEMGYNVVNVEYRLARQALAPAAVEDCFCALKWVAQHAMDFGFDVNRIVVSGESAGGHLALSLGMIPASEEMDRECAGPVPTPTPAAVVNFFGVTDVNDVIDGPNRANLAMQWFGSMPNRTELAKRLSPLTYVRRDLPPILTIHGDADKTVPYAEAVRLHEELQKAGAKNQLLTIPGGGHGRFTPEQRVKIFTVIREFLDKNGLPAN